MLPKPKEPKEFCLTAEFIAGVMAAEGNFSITRSEKWFRPQVTFVLNKVDGELVHKVYDYFKNKFGKTGKAVRERPADDTKGPALEWEVQTIHEAKRLISFFKQYPLLNNKQLSFNLWVEAVELLDKFQQITDEKLREQGFVDIAYYREVINPYGRELKFTMEDVKIIYPNANYTEPVQIAKIHNEFATFQASVPTLPLDPNFVSGYVTGDGGFKCCWKEPAKGKTTPTFDWDMNVVSIDRYIIEALKNYFKAGSIHAYKNKAEGNTFYRLMITDRREFVRIYETHFCSYPLFGKKATDAYWLYRACLALESKPSRYGPLTPEIRNEVDYCINQKSKNVYL